MRKTIGVLGLGIFGSTIAKKLGEQDIDVIAVDLNLANVNRIEPYVVQSVQGDFRDRELLEEIGISECDVVVVASGEDLEASSLAIMNCTKLGVKEIIAKSKNRAYMEILLELGASHVIRPEKEMGARLARNLMRNHILDVIDLDEETSIIEFETPKRWIGKTIQQLNIRQKYNLNIIGIKDDIHKNVDYQLSTDEKIEEGNIIVAIGEPDKFEYLDYTNQLK